MNTIRNAIADYDRARAEHAAALADYRAGRTRHADAYVGAYNRMLDARDRLDRAECPRPTAWIPYP